MALIKCTECGNKVSTNARVCPNCGYPVPQVREENEKVARTTYYIKLALYALGAVFAIIALISLIGMRHDYKMVKAQIDRESMGYEWTEAWHTENYGKLDVPSLTEDYGGELQKDLVGLGIWIILSLAFFVLALQLDHIKFLKRVLR